MRPGGRRRGTMSQERLDALLSKKRMTEAEKNEARELLGWNTPKACKYCGDDVGVERRCFAVPVCYQCLPPPEPLRTVRTRSMVESDMDTRGH